MTKKQKTILGFAAGVAAGVSYGLNPLFGKPLLDGEVPFVAHNKAFDENCLKAVFRAYGIAYPDYAVRARCGQADITIWISLPPTAVTT